LLYSCSDLGIGFNAFSLPSVRTVPGGPLKSTGDLVRTFHGEQAQNE